MLENAFKKSCFFEKGGELLIKLMVGLMRVKLTGKTWKIGICP